MQLLMGDVGIRQATHGIKSVVAINYESHAHTFGNFKISECHLTSTRLCPPFHSKL